MRKSSSYICPGLKYVEDLGASLKLEKNHGLSQQLEGMTL